MVMRFVLVVAFAVAFICPGAVGSDTPAPPAVETGSFRFRPLEDQKDIPEAYRLEERSFDYRLTLERVLATAEVRISHLTFPSPVHTPHGENNTVHAEYYCPVGKGCFPGVIVLDITAGDQSLSRTISTWLAQNGVAALFVQMAYYGPRRPPGSKLRLLMPDVDHTLAAVRQTVLDLRVASAWLESRSEVDGKKLGIMGTSLGSFMASLTGEMEPRLGRVAVLLGGGGFIDGYYDHPKAAPYRKLYEAMGGSKEKLLQENFGKRIATVDPITCAANLKDRRLLILAGKRDEIVPPRMAKALWKASGEQKIVWYDCTHYGAALYLVSAFDQVLDHFTAD
jgi:dienelactone hydrolase